MSETPSKPERAAARLGGSSFLDQLAPEERARLQRSLRERELLAGELLFAAGDAEDGLYLLECGLLEALEPDGHNERERELELTLAGQVRPGSLFGEVATLAGTGRRTASVRASRDSVVWHLPQAESRALLQSSAGFAAALGRQAVQHLLRGPFGAELSRPSEVITWVSLTRERGCMALARAAASELAARRRATLVTREDVAAALGEEALDAVPGAPAHAELTRWLNAKIDAAELVILVAGADESSWSRRCARLSEQIFGRVAISEPPTGEGITRYLEARAREGKKVYVVLDGADRDVDRVIQWLEFLPAVNMMLLDGQRPEGVEKLARLLDQSSALLRALRVNDALARLPPACLEELALALRQLQLDGGSPLISTRDAGAVIVLKGRLRVLGTREDGQPVDRVYRPGELLNYAFVDAARCETFATRDSIVGVLPRSASASLAARFPGFELALKAIEASRSGAADTRRTFAIIPLDEDADWEGRARALARQLRRYGSCAVRTAEDIEARLGERISHADPGDLGDSVLRSELDRCEQEHDYVIYVARVGDDPWTRRCLRQADHALLCTTARRGAEVDARERALLEQCAHRLGPSAHLVLWYLDPNHQPEGTLAWLEPRPGVPWYHVRGQRADDLGRLARRVLGRAIGLVFGGASSRGVAHLGILDAMRERGLEPDLIAGASSGAGFGATVATLRSRDALMEGCVIVATEFRARLSAVGPPLTSLLSGEVICRKLQEIFGDARLEDFIIPMRVAVVDLNAGELLQVDRGLAWRAIRASISLPAIWPPVVEDGRVMLDGGLIDNFPVDFVQRECRRGLMVVASLEADNVPFPDVEPYGSALSGWRVLWDRVRPRGRARSYPKLGAVLMESMLLGIRNRERALASRLDPQHALLLRPNIGRFDIFEVDEDACRRIIGLAYEQARELLREWGPEGRRPPASADEMG